MALTRAVWERRKLAFVGAYYAETSRSLTASARATRCRVVCATAVVGSAFDELLEKADWEPFAWGRRTGYHPSGRIQLWVKKQKVGLLWASGNSYETFCCGVGFNHTPGTGCMMITNRADTENALDLYKTGFYVVGKKGRAPSAK